MIILDIVKFIALIIATWFAMQIITNKNKRITYIGTLMICFSTVMIKYVDKGLLEAVIFGELIFVCFERMINKAKYKYLWPILMSFCLVGFLLLSNISFQVPIGITICTLIIYLNIKRIISQKENEIKESNKKNKKNKKTEEIENEVKETSYKNVWICALVLIILAIIISCVFYKNVPLESAYQSIMWVFPIGLFIEIALFYKLDGKYSEFILPTMLASIVFVIIVLSNKLDGIIPNYFMMIGFSILQIYIIAYIFSNVDYKLFKMVRASYLAVLIPIIVYILPIPNKVLIFKGKDVAYVLAVTQSAMILNYTDRRFWRLMSWTITVTMAIEFVGTLIVNFV